jgi:hypothetical protein
MTQEQIKMEKEFVTYELALGLKQLGFNEPCFGYYLEDGTWTPASYSEEGTAYPSNTDLLPEWSAAPLYQQAFRWFREKYELFHSINYQDDNSGPGCFDYEICDKRGKGQCGDDDSEFKTYEEAELACLEKLTEIVKQYKIIIPKETLSTKLHIGEVVDESYPEAFRKQETLEDAAKRTYQRGLQDDIDLSFYDGVRLGSKWQSERMYSREEVLSILNDFIGENPIDVDKWFEQFKKK